MGDARHLRRLEQLRIGKRQDKVRLVVRRPGRTDIWFAPAGEFGKQRGRWIYRDELGVRWGRVRHDRVSRAQGRLPYGHVVLRQDQRGGAARQAGRTRPELHYVRPQLRRATFSRRAARTPSTAPQAQARTGVDRGRARPER